MDYINYVVTGSITGFFAVLFYLLKQKDSNQGTQIQKLFDLHDKDAAALNELRIKIAENHYPKNELDMKFASLEDATKEGFRELGSKFDKISEIIVSHITQESKK